MFLIHARLGVPAGAPLPPGTASLFSSCARPGEGLEHLAVHEDAGGGAVVALFLLADDLRTAEATAAAICRRTLRERQLAHLTLLDCVSPLVGGYWEAMFAAAPAAGRDRPRPEAS
jgi:hypothetical protein